MRLLPIAALLAVCAAEPVHAAMTKADAKKLIAEFGLPESAEGMVGMLGMWGPDTPRVVEAFLTLGVRADREVTYDADGGVKLTRYPLNYLLMFSCAGESVPVSARLLLNAGADPNTTDPENDWAALAQAHACPDVIRVLLAAPKKPNVNRVDENGNTAMHYVIRFGDERQLESIRMLLDAGYDLPRFRKSLQEDVRQKPEVMALLDGKPTAAAPPKTTRAPDVTKVDWKSLPPYSQRSAADAKQLLQKPGAATTIDEHMWTGITHREPLRLSLALAAGANVRATRPGTGYTPLVLLAERCDQKDADVQAANAALLLAAGADVAGVDANGANALILASGDCPVGVVKVMLEAGISPHQRSSKGKTALQNAIDDNRPEIVALLLDAGVDPRKEPYNVRALAQGKKEIEVLLKKKRN